MKRMKKTPLWFLITLSVLTALPAAAGERSRPASRIGDASPELQKQFAREWRIVRREFPAVALAYLRAAEDALVVSPHAELFEGTFLGDLCARGLAGPEICEEEETEPDVCTQRCPLARSESDLDGTLACIEEWIGLCAG